MDDLRKPLKVLWYLVVHKSQFPLNDHPALIHAPTALSIIYMGILLQNTSPEKEDLTSVEHSLISWILPMVSQYVCDLSYLLDIQCYYMNSPSQWKRYIDGHNF